MRLEKFWDGSHSWQKGCNVLLVAAWLYANLPALAWLGRSLQSISLLNLLLVGAGTVFLLGLAVRSRSQWQLSPTPALRPLPLGLMLASGMGAVVCPWVVDIPQLPVLLFGLGSYGLFGLFLPRATWWRGLPIAALVACILPFGAQFGTGLGFPVRVLTAQIVEQFLKSWQIAAISSHDIIVLENGVARVDLPCSGLKSIWAGVLLLLAATWLERRTIGGRWLLVCFANSLMLLIANIVRVLILVLLIHWQQPQIAEMVHVPLGILGFVFACGLTWVLLQWVPRSQESGGNASDSTSKAGIRSVERSQESGLGSQELESKIQNSLAKRRKALSKIQNPKSKIQNPLAKRRRALSKILSAWLAQTTLIATVLSLGILASAYAPPLMPTIAPLQMPASIAAQPTELQPVEQRFFSNVSSTTPQKWRFAFGDLTGSLLTVSSRNWNAFHPPELCLIASGLQVDRMEKKQLTPAVLARWLTLGKQQLAATYWLQSQHHTTDDFLSRMGEYILHQNRTWVMVSILLDDDRAADDSELKAFVTLIHATIDHHLQGHSS